MKSWPDKLREVPIERLNAMIHNTRCNISIKKKDLKILERIKEERQSETIQKHKP